MLKKNKLFFLLLIISLLPLLDFFHSGLPLTHDGRDHVARIANFYQSLSEGNLVPRWAKNLNWGYGHPILMFLYPLPSYLASFFHWLGFSLVASTKIVFGLSLFLSGIFMFCWIKEIWGEKAGFSAAIVYMFAPYRFVDLYVRGAIGECWAFVWPPLIGYFVLKFSKTYQWKYLVAGSLSLAALILSHNALSLMFLPVILGYMILLVYSSPPSKRFLYFIHYTLYIILSLVLSAFFWFPAFFEGKYTLRDIVTKSGTAGFEPLSRLLWSEWHYGGTGLFSVQLGIVQWLLIVLSPFLIWKFFKQKRKEWPFLAFLLIYFCLSIFLILPLSRFLYSQITLLGKFQFAWRFLSLSIFPPAIFSGALIYSSPKRFKAVIVFCLLVASLLLNKNYWQAQDFLNKPEAFYTEAYPGTTDTGESAPRWSVRFMEDYPEATMAVIEGKAEIKAISRLTNKHVYQVKALEKTRLVENTLYFPGWQVFVDDQETQIEFQDPNHRGLMTFWVNPGDHQIIIKFGETRLRLFADLLSLGGLGFLILGTFFSLKVGCKDISDGSCRSPAPHVTHSLTSGGPRVGRPGSRHPSQAV